MLGVHDAITLPQSSKYAEEMRKWEAYHSPYGAPGRPYQYREYPKRVYKFAYEQGRGIVEVGVQDVADDTQERIAMSNGYFERQRAYDEAARTQTEHGRLAAEREWQIQHSRLSERAVAEVRAAEEAHGARHLPDVPEAPIRKRGRRPKAASDPVSA